MKSTVSPTTTERCQVRQAELNISTHFSFNMEGERVIKHIKHIGLSQQIKHKLIDARALHMRRQVSHIEKHVLPPTPKICNAWMASQSVKASYVVLEGSNLPFWYASQPVAFKNAKHHMENSGRHFYVNIVSVCHLSLLRNAVRCHFLHRSNLAPMLVGGHPGGRCNRLSKCYGPRFAFGDFWSLQAVLCLFMESSPCLPIYREELVENRGHPLSNIFSRLRR